VRWKQVVAAVVGVILLLLGLLWFLQGAAIVRLCPLLCFVDCECVMSGSVFWEGVGAIVFIVGVTIMGVIVKR
jgi:anaerobic C4-dicarboxylate transporter